MEARLSEQISPATFDVNLAALGQVDASLAGRLAKLRIPPAVRATSAHDGVPTFVLSLDGERQRWLGRTGAPSVRAQALLDRFDPGAGNVLLVGAGQGCLLARLADSLASHQAIFAYEPDPLALRLVLALHDLNDAIRDRRVVLAVGGPDGSCEDALVAALLAHRGHLMPERMLNWPWLSPHEVTSLTATMQRVADKVSAARAKETERLRRSNEAWAGAKAECDGVFVCATSTLSDTADWMDHLAAAFEEAGVRCTTFAPRTPGQRHALALLGQLSQAKPAGVVLLDCLRSGLQGLLPTGLPVVSWLGPDAFVAGAGETAWIEGDVCLVTSASVAETAVAAGVPKGLVERLPFGVATPVTDRQPGEGGDPRNVVVFADAEDCSPRAHGVALDSHATLWNALSAAIRADPESFRSRGAESYLREAERQCGVTIKDAEFRTRFREAAGKVLLPTLRKASLLQVLWDGGIQFHLWGRGWQPFPELAGCWEGTIESAGSRAGAIAGAAVVIDLDARGQVRFHHLYALQQGCVVLLESRRARGGASLWEPYWQRGQGPPTWSSPQELLATTRDLIRPAGGRAKLSAALREHCLATCRMADRLPRLLEALGLGAR